MGPNPRDQPVEVRRRAILRLWLVNFLGALLLGANYLAHVPAAPELSLPRMWLFALPALLSTAVMLTLVPAGAFWILARYVRSTRWLGLAQCSFWTVFQVALFADTRIYNMFQYHMNGQVWNLVAVRGSQDAIHLGWRVWTAIGLGLGAGILAQTWYWRRSLARAAHAHASERPPRLRARYLWGLLLLPALFEKTLYVRADFSRDHRITSLANIFPLYARVPAKDLASSVLGVDVERTPRVELDGFELDYPHARPAVDPEGPRPNVLVITIDCLRADRLSERHTPNLWRFAGDARVFEDHVSAGNSTRYGLFSLLYGLVGSYWFPVLESGTEPVLVQTLEELGYAFGIFGSASMGYPELRSTAWAGIPESVRDAFPGQVPWQRDEQAGEALARWIAEREGDERPFFAFLLLDSPHQTYSHPPEATPFEPSAPELDYMSMTRNEGPGPALLEAVINRYDNAVHHADRVAGLVLDAMRASPRFEDTLIVVTGDHGEEFLECGFFGHTSAFTEQQLRVPFLMRGPGVAPGVETGPTSHMDFPSTLLELLGANPEGRATWCQGANLLAPDPARRRVMSGWNELGVWTPDHILRVPLSKFGFDVQVFDYGWELVDDDLGVLRAEERTLEELGAACNRFLR